MTISTNAVPANLEELLTRQVRVQPLDQVNIEFRAASGTADQLLIDVLELLDAAGWSRAFESDLYLLELPQGQFRKQRGSRVRGSLVNRFHVRLWLMGDGVVGMAHHERAEPPLRHVVTSFDSGKRAVGDAFRSTPAWSVVDDAYVATWAIVDPPSNGRVTVISR